MAYVVIEDEMASIDADVFFPLHRAVRELHAGRTRPCSCAGTLSVRDEKPPQILCDTVYPLQKDMAPPPGPPASRREAPKSATIYIRVPGLESDAFRHIRLVMTMFDGRDTGENPSGRHG